MHTYLPLIDREAKNTLVANNARLSGLFPNKVTTKNLKMEQIIDKFANVSLVYVEKGSERNCYTEFAEKLPKDTVILTAGCAKYKYNKLELGNIGGIPTLPAFLSPNVAKVLVENFGIAGIGNVDKDLKVFLG